MQPDLNAPVAQAQQNKLDLKDLFTTQRGESGDYLSRFSNFVNSQPSQQALADRIGGELGLPQLRSNNQSLQNTLFNLPSTYSAATRGFDVNANQLSRIIGQKQSELSPAAALSQQNVNTAENTLNTRLGYANADFQNKLLPYQTESSMLGDRLARETTGYTQAMQSELDAIIAKMNAGVQISEGEKNRAHELAMAEQSFNNAKALNEQQAKLSGSGSSQNRYITLADGATLYDTQTGKTVSSNQKDFKATGGGGGVTNPLSGGQTVTINGRSYPVVP